MDIGSSSFHSEQESSSRRVWTDAETNALVTALEEIVARGGLCDNGTFRQGTPRLVEQALATSLPGSGIKAIPHIESKMRKLKKDYSIVFDMLNTSGFGWNDDKKCVEVDNDSVWNAYVQHHPNAKGWRNKSFPLYERVARIFGRDRATGRTAETPAEMETSDSQFRGSFEDLGDEIPPPFVNQPRGSQTSNNPSSSNRKRKRQDAIAGSLDKLSSTLVDVFKENRETTLKVVEMITTRANDDTSIEDKFQKIEDDLSNMGYSVEDRVSLLQKFVDQPTNVALFRALKTVEARQHFIGALLSKM